MTDSGNDRIQKFTCDGQFISKLGSYGSGPDQTGYSASLAVAPNGDVYIADQQNDRIQVFRQVPQHTESKAIIVAGGGPGDALWDATQMCANFAYRTLTYQGFGSKNIRYLSSNISRHYRE